MNVALTPEMQRFVDDKVRSGQFRSPSDVIDVALSVLKESEALTPEALEELRADVRVGLEQLDRGEAGDWDADDVKARLRQHVREQGSH